MPCPICVVDDVSAAAYTRRVLTTWRKGHEYYFDARGVRHQHDPNLYTVESFCSKGHRWIYRHTGSCQFCDFGSDDRELLFAGSDDLLPGTFLLVHRKTETPR